jgi:hypothetical protein
MELAFIVDISFRCLAVSRDEKPLFGYSIVLDHLLARWSMAETPEPAGESCDGWSVSGCHVTACEIMVQTLSTKFKNSWYRPF